MVIFHSYVTVYQRVVGMKQPTMSSFPALSLKMTRLTRLVCLNIGLKISWRVIIFPTFPYSLVAMLRYPPFSDPLKNHVCWLSHSDPGIPMISAMVTPTSIRSTRTQPESPAPNASRDVFTKPLVTKASISRVRLKACEGTCAGKMCGSDWKWETSGLIVEKGGTIKLHQNRWMLRLRLPEAAGKKQETPTASGSTGFLMDLMAEMKSRFNQVSNWPDFRRVSKSSATIKANIAHICAPHRRTPLVMKVQSPI